MSEIELHRKLLGDTGRNRAFHAALQQVITPGVTTVVDLGAGTGFLSFLARQLGARHCHLIEYSEALSLAQQLARDNQLTGLQFSNAHSGEIANPPKVDLAISETLGNYALEEGMLETLVDARRYLKPGGRILPCALRQFVATVRDPSLQQDIDLWGAVGFGLNLEAARAVGLNNLYVRRIAPGQLGSAGLCWDDLDFSPDAPAPPSRRQQQIRLTPTPQTVHGLALWWECTLVPGIVLSTAPGAPDTHWDQVYLPLLDPVHVEAGDELRITLISDTRAEVGLRLLWQVAHYRAGRRLHAQQLDSARGQLSA
jgi:SAM-dependent methyltransferase